MSISREYDQRRRPRARPFRKSIYMLTLYRTIFHFSSATPFFFVFHFFTPSEEPRAGYATDKWNAQCFDSPHCLACCETVIVTGQNQRVTQFRYKSPKPLYSSFYLLIIFCCSWNTIVIWKIAIKKWIFSRVNNGRAWVFFRSMLKFSSISETVDL